MSDREVRPRSRRSPTRWTPPTASPARSTASASTPSSARADPRRHGHTHHRPRHAREARRLELGAGVMARMVWNLALDWLVGPCRAWTSFWIRRSRRTRRTRSCSGSGRARIRGENGLCPHAGVQYAHIVDPGRSGRPAGFKNGRWKPRRVRFVGQIEPSKVRRDRICFRIDHFSTVV